MGGVLAELLVRTGATVTLVTPAAYVSEWTVNTLEQATIHKRLVESGVNIVLNRGIASIAPDHVLSNCVFSDQITAMEASACVIVASRTSTQAPGPIAWATYAGHRYARELDMPDTGDALSFRREVTQLQLIQ